MTDYLDTNDDGDGTSTRDELDFDEDGNIYDRDWDFSTPEASLKTIIDKIAEALNTTWKEKMTVYDPTTVSGTALAAEIKDEDVTAGPVLLLSIGEIVEAITVTAVPGFAANTSGQLATDTSLTYSAE